MLNVVDAVLKLLLNRFFYSVSTACPLAAKKKSLPYLSGTNYAKVLTTKSSIPLKLNLCMTLI